MSTSPIKDSEVSLLSSLQPRTAELDPLQLIKVVISLQFLFLLSFFPTKEKASASEYLDIRVCFSYFKSRR
jgi:hypothetical protein